MIVTARAIAAAIGAALLVGAGGASATTFMLKDTGVGSTDILNTTGELTGGDSAVAASSAGAAFVDTALFTISPGEELTSYSLTTLGTPKIGEISGGTMEIFQVVGATEIPVLATLTTILTAPAHTISSQTSFSSDFNLGAGRVPAENRQQRRRRREDPRQCKIFGRAARQRGPGTRDLGGDADGLRRDRRFGAARPSQAGRGDRLIGSQT